VAPSRHETGADDDRQKTSSGSAPHAGKVLRPDALADKAMADACTMLSRDAGLKRYIDRQIRKLQPFSRKTAHAKLFAAAGPFRASCSEMASSSPQW